MAKVVYCAEEAMLIMRAVRVVQNIPLYILARDTGISSGRLSLIERELAVATHEERQKLVLGLQTNAEVLFQPATTGAFVESGVEG
jgi:hypothetical protein